MCKGVSGSVLDGVSDPYLDFLRAKIKFAPMAGFPCDESEVNPILLAHQRAVVVWAVEGGRRLLGENFGLGKTVQQLEIERIILKKLGGGRGLIILPLGVRQEFMRDARMLGIELRFVRRTEEVQGDGIYLTNYESVRDGKLDPSLFSVVSLDEGAILRSFGSKTFITFLDVLSGIPYRFVATATPDPNKYKELLHYAAFLGIMDSGQGLTRWFQRDSTKANNLTLYPHKEQEFWLWLSTWAIFLQTPSDLGYSDEGYILPELKVVYHEIPSDSLGLIERDGQARLFNDASLGLSEAAREKRESLPGRIAKMMEIIGQSPEDHFLLWHDLEAERHAIQEALPEAVAVYGQQDEQETEKRLIGFAEGEFQYLSTKPVIAGAGCNFQRHCHKAIFLGVGYKFADFIQAVHRIHRFQQKHQCEVHIIHTDAERDILATLRGKWDRHKEKVGRMTGILREHGLNSISKADVLSRTIGVVRQEVRGERFIAVNNDCVLELREWEDSSIDMHLTSIPFANHYEYTPSYNDFGHTDGNPHFWEQMDFLTPQMLRTLKPGRICCIHVKDRVNFGNVTGAGVPTISPFHAEAIFHYIKHGFDYMGMITIVTDVVRENNQTYRLGWSEQCKDGTKMGVGSPEYVLIFHKPQTDRTKGYADEPVVKSKQEYTRARWQVDAHAFWRSSGNRLLTVDDLVGLGPDKLASLFTKYSMLNIYDYEQHVAIGEELEEQDMLPATFMSLAPGSHHPDVWTDVNRMKNLNGTQSQRGLQMHVCPFPEDIVRRLIGRFTNEGELVYDVFGGLFTTPKNAVEMGRRGAGTELNTGYFLDGVAYCKAAEEERLMPTLFDALEAEGSFIK